MRLLVKIGGTLLDALESRRRLACELAAAVAGGGIQMTVVHGGGKQMTRFLAERGIESRFVNGLRVTTPETLDAVVKVLAGSRGRELASQAPTGFQGVEQRAADLDQQPHSSPSVSGRASTRFMFWRAWPAAPFTRLSIALTTTARPVAGSSFTPISQ